MLSNSGSNELKYMIYFSSPFKDSTNKLARTNKYFNFGSTRNDFALFSVKSQTVNPFISSIQAIDGSSSDIIKITFNKSMDVIGRNLLELTLKYSAFPVDSAYQYFAYNTSGATNSATILGFSYDKSSTNSVYMVGRLKTADIQAANTAKSGASLSLKPLGGAFSNISTSYGSLSSPLRTATITDNVVTLEFSPLAFDKGDIVILSAGSSIKGTYNDTANTVSVPSLSPGSFSFFSIKDPSNLPLSSSNASVSSNIDINDSQKVVVAQ